MGSYIVIKKDITDNKGNQKLVLKCFRVCFVILWFLPNTKHRTQSKECSSNHPAALLLLSIWAAVK